MKKTCMIMGCALLLVVQSYAAGKMMSVQVRETSLRDKPSFLGKPAGTLSYGDRVELLAEKGAWSRVGIDGKAGWLHTAALTRKKLDKAAGSADLSKTASSDELALAGKGFSEEVENEFKEQNKEINFDAVDAMEKIVIPENEMRNFLIEGGVIAPEGGV